MKAKTVLVTGGAGFIGSHLCRHLLEEGNHVVCLDNLSSGQAEHVEELSAFPNFRFIRADVAEEFPALHPDEIYHLACPASPPFYQADPLQTMKTCFLGTLNMLTLAQRCGARLLFTSTSEVYGDPEVHPQKEDYWGHVNPCGIRSCYDEGKRIAEAMLFDADRRRLADVRVVRLFNTYGPGMRDDDGRVVSNFIMQALKGEDLTVFGEGAQTRSLCYIDDTVRALLSMMKQDDFAGPVNIGNPEEVAVRQIAEEVIALTGSHSSIVHRPLPSDDPVRRKPDIARARKYLHWEPTVSRAEGLKRTIEYFRSVSETDRSRRNQNV